MAIDYPHAELLADVKFKAGAAGILLAGQGGHGVALHQGLDVAAHAFAPGTRVWVELRGVDNAVPGGS